MVIENKNENELEVNIIKKRKKKLIKMFNELLELTKLRIKIMIDGLEQDKEICEIYGEMEECHKAIIGEENNLINIITSEMPKIALLEMIEKQAKIDIENDNDKEKIVQ